MADTAVAITAGTGTNIDTRTEATNGNHRQVVVLGDPSTNAGVAPVDATNGLSVNVTNASLTVGSHAVTDGGGSLTVDNAGTFAVQATLAAETTKNIGTVRMSDGTNTAAVKAASTAPSAADPAIVVAMSPNTQNANGQATMANSTPVVMASDFTGTSGFMKKEDVASADGDAGIPAMAVRKATPANTSGTDGDYEMLQMSAGRLWVSDSPSMANFGAGEYETVAASQTAQALGATGATGDYISGILVVPATTSPGNVLLLDNATSITVFAGGASSVSNLVPFFIPLGMISVSGAWKITTGANVSCIGIGNFT